jgi:hypothetical protein
MATLLAEIERTMKKLRGPGYGLFSKPHADGGELDEGEIARGQLVVADRDPPIPP